MSKPPGTVMRTRATLAVLMGAMALWTVPQAFGGDADRDYSVGQSVANFVLPDTDGRQVALADFNDKSAVLLFTMGTGCPISNLYISELGRLQEKFAESGLQIIGLQSNAGITGEDIAKHAEEFKVPFPVLLDADQTVANMLGVKRTAEALLLDNYRVVRYHGRVDDRFGYTFKRAKATRRDLFEALTELFSGEPVSVATTEPLGCLITHNKSSKSEEITYAKHVSRIIQDRCQGCHRPGSIGPFALMDYDDLRNFTEMTREVILQRRMPPWHADPRYGHFSTDRSLSKEQLATLVAWIDAGAPFGDEKDLPPAREYYEGWNIGQPDLVFRLPEVQTIPADGVIPYMRFTIDPGFEEDVWYSAAECLPDNDAVVHHIQAYAILPPPKPGEREPVEAMRPRTEEDEEDSRNRRRRSRRRRSKLITSFAPGEEPFEFPHGIGGRIPAGSKISITMHYTPTGKEEQDQSLLGIKLYRGVPQREAFTSAAVNARFEIPPRAANHPVEAAYLFEHDSLIISLHPHMHLRGKDMKYTAIYPDGKEEVILSVPQFDFNWQNTYRYHEPKLMPAGTRLRVVGHFNNSAQNLANPDPDKAITWGPQTWDEMFIGYLNYTTAETRDELAAAKAAATDGD